MQFWRKKIGNVKLYFRGDFIVASYGASTSQIIVSRPIFIKISHEIDSVSVCSFETDKSGRAKDIDNRLNLSRFLHVFGVFACCDEIFTFFFTKLKPYQRLMIFEVIFVKIYDRKRGMFWAIAKKHFLKGVFCIDGLMADCWHALSARLGMGMPNA